MGSISKKPYLVPIDREKVPSDWHWLLTNLEAEFSIALKKYKTDKTINFAGLAVHHRIMGIHSMIKFLWSSRHKIPSGARGKAKAYECVGEFYAAIAELVMDLDFRKFGYARDYLGGSSQWFADVVLEGALDAQFEDTLDVNKPKVIKYLQSQNKALRSYENPFDEVNTPHTYKLIKSAIESAENPHLDKFRSRVWYRFLRTRCQLVSEYQKPHWSAIRGTSDCPTVVLPQSSGGGNQIEVGKCFYSKKRPLMKDCQK